MLNSLYEGIGGKIKNWAKWMFIVEAIAAIIGGIVLVASDAAVVAFVGLVVLICGPIVAWVGSWILYAFGELVEDVHAMRNKEVPTKVNVASPTTTPRDTTQTKETLQPIPTKPDTPPVVQGRSPSVETSPSPRKVYAEGEFILGRSYTNGDEVIFENKKYVCLASGTTVWSPSQYPAQWQEIPD